MRLSKGQAAWLTIMLLSGAVMCTQYLNLFDLGRPRAGEALHYGLGVEPGGDTAAGATMRVTAKGKEEAHISFEAQRDASATYHLFLPSRAELTSAGGCEQVEELDGPDGSIFRIPTRADCTASASIIVQQPNMQRRLNVDTWRLSLVRTPASVMQLSGADIGRPPAAEAGTVAIEMIVSRRVSFEDTYPQAEVGSNPQSRNWAVVADAYDFSPVTADLSYGAWTLFFQSATGLIATAAGALFAVPALRSFHRGSVHDRERRTVA